MLSKDSESLFKSVASLLPETQAKRTVVLDINIKDNTRAIKMKVNKASAPLKEWEINLYQVKFLKHIFWGCVGKIEC